MASKRLIAIAWFLILAVTVVGFAWSLWPSSNSGESTDQRYDRSIYENLDPSFSREHMRGRLISAASKNPGFGGVFLSRRATVLNIYIAEDENDPEQWDRDRQALEELLDPQSGLKLNVIKGDYTIAQLSEWYDLMQSEGIWDQDGVHMTDLHEGINKLYIGVSSEWDVEGVYTFLEGIGIPRQAAAVEAVEQAKPQKRDGGHPSSSTSSRPERQRVPGSSAIRCWSHHGRSILQEILSLLFPSANDTSPLPQPFTHPYHN